MFIGYKIKKMKKPNIQHLNKILSNGYKHYIALNDSFFNKI